MRLQDPADSSIYYGAQGYKDNDITNLFITITSHGQQANVVFDMGDRHVVMEGWMFHVDK